MAVKLRQRKLNESSCSRKIEVFDDDNDIQNLLNGIIDEEIIYNACGEKDMLKIEHLTIHVDSNNQSILNISDILPNLKSLTLDHSIISSVRDLGIGLRNLKALSLCGCGLYDLDGIGVLTGLEELLLCDNFISDVTPLALHDNIRVLNLTGNKVSDISVIDSLSSCLRLRSLFLSRNPLERAPNYRKIISSMINNLDLLDGKKLDRTTNNVSNAMILEAASSMQLLEEEMEDENRLEACILGDVTVVNDFKGMNSPITNNNYQNPSMIPDTGSELTHGSSVVLAGNVAAAMRKRRNKLNGKDFLLGDEVADETESALDIIDSAAKYPICQSPSTKETKQLNKCFFTQFFKEGDISSTMMTDSQMQQAMQIMNLNVVDSAVSDYETPLAIDFDMERDDRRDLFSDSPATHTRPSTGMSTSRTKSARRLAASSSGRQETMGCLFDKPLEIDADRYGKEPSQSNSFSSRSSSAHRRPKSASSGGRLSAESPFSPPTKTYSGSTANTMLSPRQMNSSRPQSALSSSNSTEGDGVYSLPFRVAANDEEMQLMKVMSKKAGFTGPIPAGSPAAAAASRTASTHMIGTEAANGSMTRGDLEPGYKSLPTSRSEVVDASLDDRVKGVAMLDESGGVGDKASSGNGKKMFQIRRLQKIVDTDSESDSEDIAITHAARRQLMSDSSQIPLFNSSGHSNSIRRSASRPMFLPPRNPTNSVTNSKNSANTPSLNASLPMMAFAGHEAPANESERADACDSQPSTGRLSSAATPYNEAMLSSKSDQTDSPRIFHRSEDMSSQISTKSQEKFVHTVSSMAGMSLGFNLTGSLAAIDKWVQDMNSDDDDDDDNEGDRLPKSNQSSRLSSGVSRISEQTLAPGSDFSVNDADSKQPDDGDALFDDYQKRLSAEALLRKAVFLSEPVLDKESRDSIVNDLCPQSPSLQSPTTLNAVRVVGAKAVKANKQAKKDQIHSQPSPMDSSTMEPDIFSPSRNVVMMEMKKKKTKSSGSAVKPSKLLDIVDSTLDGNEARLVEETVSASKSKTISCSQTEADKCVFGKGVFLSDQDIIELLRKPPKTTEVLRTKGSFQDFFRGINSKRINHLLERAYVDIDDVDERSNKVNKRMDLLKEVLTF
mmetsp:Transcript_30517/g.41989  ORF Transcript_30517/g.41989 Transcript_30517/m.41989 type:complete len:1121 (-) Transcript_30517:165-3527(-)